MAGYNDDDIELIQNGTTTEGDDLTASQINFFPNLVVTSGGSNTNSIDPSSVHALQTAVTGLQKQHRDLSRKYEELQQRNKIMNKALMSLEAEKMEPRSHYENEMNGLGPPASGAVGGEGSMSAEVRARQGYASHLERQLMHSQLGLQKAQNEIVRLNKQAADLDQALKQALTEKERLQQDLDMVRETLDRSRDDVRLRDSKLSNLETRMQDLENENARLASIVLDRESDIVSLKERLQQYEKGGYRNRDQDSEIEILRHNLGRLDAKDKEREAQVRKLQREVDDKNEEIHHLQTKLNEFMSEVQSQGGEGPSRGFDEPDSALIKDALTRVTDERLQIQKLQQQLREQQELIEKVVAVGREKLLNQRERQQKEPEQNNYQETRQNYPIAGSSMKPQFEESYDKNQSKCDYMDSPPENKLHGIRDAYTTESNIPVTKNLPISISQLSPIQTNNLVSTTVISRPMAGSPIYSNTRDMIRNEPKSSYLNIGQAHAAVLPNSGSNESCNVHRTPYGEASSSAQYRTVYLENETPRTVLVTASSHSPVRQVFSSPTGQNIMGADRYAVRPSLSSPASQVVVGPPNIPMNQISTTEERYSPQFMGHDNNLRKIHSEAQIVNPTMPPRTVGSDPNIGSGGRPGNFAFPTPNIYNDTNAFPRNSADSSPTYENIWDKNRVPPGGGQGTENESRFQMSNTENRIRPQPSENSNPANVLREISGAENTEVKICPLCSRDFSELTMDQFQTHVFECFDDAPETMQAQPHNSSGNRGNQSGTDDKICPMCNAIFPSSVAHENFERHVLGHFDEEPVVDTFEVVSPDA